MTAADLPASYEAWHHCITVKCRTPLTPEYARQRAAALADPAAPEAKRFAELYGDDHRRRVAGWFQRAAG
jgi:hypothetical protein